MAALSNKPSSASLSAVKWLYWSLTRFAVNARRRNRHFRGREGQEASSIRGSGGNCCNDRLQSIRPSKNGRKGGAPTEGKAKGGGSCRGTEKKEAPLPSFLIKKKQKKTKPQLLPRRNDLKKIWGRSVISKPNGKEIIS